jgi:hypothetical protein
MNLAELEQELLTEIERRPQRLPRLIVRWPRLLEPSIDMLSAAITLGWGTLLLVIADIFSRAQAYTAMSAIAPAPVWGWALLLSGLLQLAGVVVRRPPVRLVAQTWAAAQWTFMAVMFSQASVGGVKTGAVTYGMLALFLLIRTLIKPEK